MVFSDTTTYQGIVQEVDFYCDTTVVNYPLVDKARSANRSMDEVTAIIIGMDGKADWVDNNLTTLPIDYTNLTANQRDYGFDSAHLFIKQIRVKNSTGNWSVLDVLSNNDVVANSTATGTPTHYSILGTSYLLSPTPNYNSTAGIEILYQQKGSYFVSTDTTKEPGFASHLHRFVVWCMCVDWFTKTNNQGKLVVALNKKTEYVDMIKKFYSRRDKDIPRRLKMAIGSNR